MRRFVIKTLIFLAPLVVLLALMEYVDRNAYRGPLRYKREYVERHGSEITTLILGPSHTYDGVDPALLGPGAFSLAFNSQTVDYDYQILADLGPLMPNLKRVILPVGYLTMTQKSVDEQPEWFITIDYYRQMGLRKHHPLSRQAFYLSHPFMASQRFKNILLGIPDVNQCDSLGRSTRFTYNPADTLWRANARRDAIAHKARRSLDIAERARYIDLIARWCAQRGVQLILITTPLHPDYLDATWPRQWSTVDSAVAIARRHIPQTPYLDFRRMPQLGDSAFSDASHLNCDVGAPIFSRILADSLNKLQPK